MRIRRFLKTITSERAALAGMLLVIEVEFEVYQTFKMF